VRACEQAFDARWAKPSLSLSRTASFGLAKSNLAVAQQIA
jgi:hypothetical protein